MPDEPRIDGSVASQAAFKSVLDELVEKALENDVNPQGAWECREGQADLEIVVVELDD